MTTGLIGNTNSRFVNLVPGDETAGAVALPERYIPIDPTKDYWVSFYSYLRTRSAGTAKVLLREYNSANTLLATTTLLSLTAVQTAVTRHATLITSFNASTTKAKVVFFADGTPNMEWFVDAVSVVESTALTAPAYVTRESEVGPFNPLDENLPTGMLLVAPMNGTLVADGVSNGFVFDIPSTWAGRTYPIIAFSGTATQLTITLSGTTKAITYSGSMSVPVTVNTGDLTATTSAGTNVIPNLVNPNFGMALLPDKRYAFSVTNVVGGTAGSNISIQARYGR